jgi:hypothetical protein
MSNELGPSISIGPGATLFGLEVWVTSPGWQNLVLWVPRPQQVSTISYGSEYVALEGDGTYHFGKNVTNDSGTTIDFDFEYSNL